MKTLVTVLAAVLFCATLGYTENPTLTPIQDQFKANILAMSARGEFDNAPASKSNADAERSTSKPKSGLKAVLLSALLPGAGQYYLGYKSRARFYFGTEAAGWIGFGAFRMYGSWRQDDFIRYARDRAGAQLNGKTREFQDLVGFYSDIDQYNSLGRATDPERAYLYDTPENHWRWQSQEDQATYRSIKNASREAYRRANFMIGLVVINRLVSMIDVYRLLRRSHTATGESFSDAGSPKFRFDVNPFASTRQVSLTYRMPF